MHLICQLQNCNNKPCLFPNNSTWNCNRTMTSVGSEPLPPPPRHNIHLNAPSPTSHLVPYPALHFRPWA